MSDSLTFAQRVLTSSGEGTTHLKLQKLLFYAYGAARATQQSVPITQFVNWQHGPVCVEVYEHFKAAGGSPLALDNSFPKLEGAALDAVRVYGALSAWQLRQESHLERPWLETSLGMSIPEELLVEHFREKFLGSVLAPKNLAGSWSLSADRLPTLSAPSLGELAEALGR